MDFLAVVVQSLVGNVLLGANQDKWGTLSEITFCHRKIESVSALVMSQVDFNLQHNLCNPPCHLTCLFILQICQLKLVKNLMLLDYV